MQRCTYLNESVKEGKITRWTITNFNVYIAPMKFYSKQGEDFKYRKMVLDAFSAWSSASQGLLTFHITDVLLESNINVDWKRVERKALGHCYFSYDATGTLYGAEVAIGLTDGRIHQQYDSDVEVYHTILHEIGHALGLGHSPYKSDIMYTPHQYGNATLSGNDKYSIQWLYRLPAGMPVIKFAEKYSVSTSTDVDSVIRQIDGKKNSNKSTVVNQVQKQRDLLEESANIGDLKKYNVLLQNIAISPNVKNYLDNNRNST